jgi:4-hydroxybenzoyl-CoA thioesterase
MARIEVKLPEFFPFSTEVRVRIGDVNYGNHLGNDSILALIHEVRVRFLRSRGYSEMDIDGRGLILTDTAIVYKSQAFHGDCLTVYASAGDFNKYGCDFFFKIVQKTSGTEVARAKTGVVFFDYQRQKIVSTPAAFIDSFRRKA